LVIRSQRFPPRFWKQAQKRRRQAAVGTLSELYHQGAGLHKGT
jgi:hypothetical protein